MAAEQGDKRVEDILKNYNTKSGKIVLLFSDVTGIDNKWYKSIEFIDEYEKNAKLGDGEAQYEFARQLENLNNVGPFCYDIEQAVYWYTRAADNGIIDAMFNLGVIYKYGKANFSSNMEKAKKWLKKCADAGDEEAKNILEKEF